MEPAPPLLPVLIGSECVWRSIIKTSEDSDASEQISRGGGRIFARFADRAGAERFPFYFGGCFFNVEFFTVLLDRFTEHRKHISRGNGFPRADTLILFHGDRRAARSDVIKHAHGRIWQNKVKVSTFIWDIFQDARGAKRPFASCFMRAGRGLLFVKRPINYFLTARRGRIKIPGDMNMWDAARIKPRERNGPM